MGRKLINFIQQYYLIIVVFLAIFVGMLYVHLKLYQYALDDAYIHFRIVENWIDTGFPYFNLDEPIKASSSTAWLVTLFLIMQVVEIFGGHIELPLIVAIVNSIALVVGMIFFFIIFLRISKRQQGVLNLIGFSIIYISLGINSSLGLMESTLTIAVTGLAYILFMDQKKISLTLFAVVVFFRLELIILYAIIGIYSLYSKRFSLKDIIIFTLLGVIPFAVLDLYYYLTLIPNTIHAKSMIYQLSFIHQIEVIISRIGNHYRIFLPKFDQFIRFYLFVLIFIPMIVLSVYIFQLVRARRNVLGEYGLLLLGWGLGVIALYLVSGVLIFSWYEPLFMIPLFVVIFAFLVVNFDGRFSIISKSILLSIVILQVFALLQVISAGIFNPAFLPLFPEGARTKQYLSIGEQLYKDFPEAKLLTSEIGGLGYGFRGYILDSAGLVSPEVLEYPEAINSGGRVITRFITDERPEIIVSYDIFIEDAFLKDSTSEYYIESYPVYAKEDMGRSIIKTPWGDGYQRILWLSQGLFVLTSHELLDVE